MCENSNGNVNLNTKIRKREMNTYDYRGCDFYIGIGISLPILGKIAATINKILINFVAGNLNKRLSMKKATVIHIAVSSLKEMKTKIFSLLLLVVFFSTGHAQTELQSFTRKMQEANWHYDKTTSVYYPSFFIHYEDDDIENTMWWDVYEWRLVALYYAYVHQARELESFPMTGSYIAKGVKAKSVKKITDNIVTGYTSDNRIYYMKRLLSYPSDPAIGPCVYYLALIYPFSYQQSVGNLIKSVQNFRGNY